MGEAIKTPKANTIFTEFIEWGYASSIPRPMSNIGKRTVARSMREKILFKCFFI